MIKELFKDSAKYLPSMAVPALVGLIAIPIITRLFPPEVYGNYILVIATVSFLSTIAVAWLGSSTIRFYPAYELNGELNKFYSVLLKLTISSVGAVSILFLIILFLLESQVSVSIVSLMRIGVLLFIVSSFWSVLLNVLRAKRNAGWYSALSIWTSVAGLGIGLAMVLILHTGIEGLLWGAIISIVIAIPLLWKISLGIPSLKDGNVRSQMGWEIAKYGIPAMGINVLTWAQSLSDRYILEFFRDSQEVGIYSASYAISERSIFFITSLFLLASSPIGFSIWERQGVKASQEFMKKLTRYYLLVGLPAAVGLCLLAKPITHLLVAPQYYLGYRIIPLVAFGAFFVGVAHRFTIGLSYHKRTDLLMLCYLGSVVLNVALNFIYIPKYGYMAAAGTTFVSYAFLLLSAIFVSRRFFVWEFPFRSLGKVICASGVMGAVVYPVGNNLTASPLINLIVSIPIGVTVYAMVLFLLGEIQANEKKAVRQVLVRYLPPGLTPSSWK